MEQRRLTAKIAGIEEIVRGNFVHKGGRESSYVLTQLGRKLTRVRVLGLIVDKFTSADERMATITLDDGTETIRCKSFVNVKIFDRFTTGDLVEVIGKVREYADEIYLTPEIVRKMNANAETLRLLELRTIYERQRDCIAKAGLSGSELPAGMAQEDFEGALAIATATGKPKLLELIETAGPEGADYQQLIAQAGMPQAAVDAILHELLAAGVVFEPRPGKIKKCEDACKAMRSY